MGHVADVLEENVTLPGFAIVFFESRKKNSPPLTWIVVAAGAACRSVRAPASGTTARAAIDSAASPATELV